VAEALDEDGRDGSPMHWDQYQGLLRLHKNPSGTVSVPKLADITAAAARLAGHVVQTPCLESRTLGQILGSRVFLKFENLQYTASFKERGALNKLLSLVSGGRGTKGLIAASAGNHAQGLVSDGSAALCAAVDTARLRSSAVNGCSKWEREQGSDDELDPPLTA
jgi:hypothetical protein